MSMIMFLILVLLFSSQCSDQSCAGLRHSTPPLTVPWSPMITRAGTRVRVSVTLVQQLVLTPETAAAELSSLCLICLQHQRSDTGADHSVGCDQ